MHGGRDHRARDTHALGDVPFHLRAQHEFRIGGGHGLFHFQVIVADHRFYAQLGGRIAHIAGALAAVGAQAHHFKAHGFGGDARRRQGVGGIAEDEDALAREVGGVDRTGIPRRARLRGRQPGHAGVLVAQHGPRVHTRQRRHLGDEVARGVHADGYDLRIRHAKSTLQPLRRGTRNLRVEVDIETGVWQPPQVFHGSPQRHYGIDLDAQLGEQAVDFNDVVAAAKSQRRRAQDIDQRCLARRRRRHAGAVRQYRAHHLVQGFAGAPVFLF